MEENVKKLNVWEAACIITGYGIGGGVMALPYLAEKCGVFVGICVILVAFIASYLLHMMIAQLAVGSGGNSQIVEIFSKYILRGKFQKAGTIIFFIIMVVVLYTNLAAYVSGAAEILNSLLGLPLWLSKIIFYVVAAIVAIFGLKILGISESYAVIVIYAVITVLAVASCFNISNPLPLDVDSLKDVIAFFGMVMFSFAAFFSVPQVVKGLSSDEKKVKKAVFIGLGNNFVLMIIVIICALLSSETITEVGMTGWSKGIGLWAEILGSVFTVLAMLTTYWSISLALVDIVKEQLKLNEKLCWIIGTVPSLIISFIPMAGFMEFLELAAGAIAIIIAIFVVPAYHNCLKEYDGKRLLGKFSGLPIEIFVVVAYLLMAVGSIL